MLGGGDWVRMWGVNVGSGGVRNKCNVGECTRWDWLSMEHVGVSVYKASEVSSCWWVGVGG